VYQEYFMVSNAAQLILDEAIERGSNLHDLPDYAVVQINDTHPSMVIPELVRLLVDVHGFEFDEAVSVVRRMVAYTNHTILAEALEKWPLESLKTVSPRIAEIVSQAGRATSAPRMAATTPAVAIVRRRRGAHGTYGYPLWLLDQRRGGAAHQDPRGHRAQPFYELYPRSSRTRRTASRSAAGSWMPTRR
jgi:starch phosphorylase